MKTSTGKKNIKKKYTLIEFNSNIKGKIADFFLVKVQSEKKGARIVEICEQRKGGRTKHMAHKTLIGSKQLL